METENTLELPISVLTKNQKIKTGWKLIGPKERMRVELRYDDECGNGHNTFAITAETEIKLKNNQWREDSGGCLHEEIAKHYPEYAHLIKWHLCSSDGPMHYPANVLYAAGDRDCWGKKEGDVSRYELKIQFGAFPITFKYSEKFIRWLQEIGQPGRENLVIEEIPYKGTTDYDFSPKYTYQGFGYEWHTCPFDTLQEAKQFKEACETYSFNVLKIPTAWSKGKERELDTARNSAIWPEATDEELTSDNLKERLIERLPGLIAEFKIAMESLGFIF